MPKILGIETTGEKCSISLFTETTIIASIKNDDANQHSAVLHMMIQSLLEQNNIPISELNAIALSKGPGSYTGLRIGSSSAKGLCVALNIPLISIASHEAMLFDNTVKDFLPDFENVYCFTDARRDDVFCSHFSNNKMNGKVKVLNLTEPDTQNQINTSASLIFGSGALKAKALLSTQHTYVTKPCLHASNLHTLAITKYNSNHFEDIAYFEPSYEKEFYVVPSKKKQLP